MAATLFALGVGAAYAQQDDMVARIDTDHDGVITRAEFAAAHNARFDAMDVNHDGMLTGAEAPHWHGQGPDAMTRDEYAAHADGVFDRYDADHDGRLAGAELDAFREHVNSYAHEQQQGQHQ